MLAPSATRPALRPHAAVSSINANSAPSSLARPIIVARAAKNAPGPTARPFGSLAVPKRAGAGSSSALAAAAPGAAWPLEGVQLLDARGNEAPLPIWGEDQTAVFALLRVSLHHRGPVYTNAYYLFCQFSNAWTSTMTRWTRWKCVMCSCHDFHGTGC